MKPAIVAGGLTAIVTGGLMAALTASGGRLSGSVPAILALATPLLAAGLVFGWLIESKRLRAGFGPGILYWIAGFPVARLAQELLVGEVPTGGLAGFLVYQAMVGGAFGLGFVILHNQLWNLLLRSRRANNGEQDEESRELQARTGRRR